MTARAEAREEMYGELETVEGQKKIYKIAKSRGRKTMDQTHIRHMKGGNRNVLYKDNDIKRRWKDYFEGPLNEENLRIPSREGIQSKKKTVV